MHGLKTGLLVFVFQDGRLTGVLDYVGQSGIEQTEPDHPLNCYEKHGHRQYRGGEQLQWPPLSSLPERQ